MIRLVWNQRIVAITEEFTQTNYRKDDQGKTVSDLKSQGWVIVTEDNVVHYVGREKPEGFEVGQVVKISMEVTR
jgi:peroxiredoxin